MFPFRIDYLIGEGETNVIGAVTTIRYDRMRYDWSFFNQVLISHNDDEFIFGIITAGAVTQAAGSSNEFQRYIESVFQ